MGGGRDGGVVKKLLIGFDDGLVKLLDRERDHFPLTPSGKRVPRTTVIRTLVLEGLKGRAEARGDTLPSAEALSGVVYEGTEESGA